MKRISREEEHLNYYNDCMAGHARIYQDPKPMPKARRHPKVAALLATHQRAPRWRTATLKVNIRARFTRWTKGEKVFALKVTRHWHLIQKLKLPRKHLPLTSQCGGIEAVYLTLHDFCPAPPEP